MKKRVVKLGRAKDYQRDAKYYTYAYITVNKQSHTLNLYGWHGLDVINEKVKINEEEYHLVFT